MFLMIGGALLAVACGALNGSWVVPTKANAPKVLRVTDALPWEAFWLIFNVSLVLINGAVTIGIQGSNLFQSLRNTDPTQLALVCLCFLGWGIGATGYGLSVKRVGVALGTAFVLSAATVVGTILPIILDVHEAMSQIWFLAGGVMVALVGFAILAKANLMKDADLATVSGTSVLKSIELSAVYEDTDPGTIAAAVVPENTDISGSSVLKMISVSENPAFEAGRTDAVAAVAPVATYEPDAESDAISHRFNSVDAEETDDAHSVVAAAYAGSSMGHSGSVPVLGISGGLPRIQGPSVELKHVVPVANELKRGGLGFSSGVLEEAVKGPRERSEVKPVNQFWVNIAICLVSGIARAALNVGLVLGKEIEAEGQALGSSEVRSGMAVWFLGFNMCALPGILYSAILLSRNGTWEKLRWHQEALTTRRLSVTIGSAATWVVLLHFYGVATFWLGPQGNAVAWPLLLASTILSAQFWSQAVLGEWKGVSRKTMRLNAVALGVLILSVLITAAGVFVDEFS